MLQSIDCSNVSFQIHSCVHSYSTGFSYWSSFHPYAFSHGSTQFLTTRILWIDGCHHCWYRWGSVTIPTSLSPPVPLFPAPLLDSTQQSLILILQPNLAEDDLAFKHSTSNTLNSSTGTIGAGNYVEKEDEDEMKDKQIRAVFMRLFALLLQGWVSYFCFPKEIVVCNQT